MSIDPTQLAYRPAISYTVIKTYEEDKSMLYLTCPALIFHQSSVYVHCSPLYRPKPCASDRKTKAAELERVLTSFVLYYGYLNTFLWSLKKAYAIIGSRNGVKTVSIRISRNRRLRNFPWGFKASGKPRFHLILSLLYNNGCATNCRQRSQKRYIEMNSFAHYDRFQIRSSYLYVYSTFFSLHT